MNGVGAKNPNPAETLAVHSEAPLTVETVKLDAELLGRAVVALTTAAGEKIPVLQNRMTGQVGGTLAQAG